VGSTSSIKVDVRIIAATNRLEQFVKDKFRMIYLSLECRADHAALAQAQVRHPDARPSLLQKCAAGSTTAVRGVSGYWTV
jgi:transcriptional regulator of acetoin/glycerol metabolism